ncbi:MAG: hypothetical protein GY714_01955 [Desulfobacterales bacterium]|nr:hypothetical protein [Desulfobacterales bacterium]
MTFALQTATYNYETILDILDKNPLGISVIEIRDKYKIHEEYDILANINWKGSKKRIQNGEEPHYETVRDHGSPLKFIITESGKAHLKTVEHLVQHNIPNVELQWKRGYNKDGTRNEEFISRSGSRAAEKPKVQQQALLPIEEPIVLSSVAQRATDILQDVIVSNHTAKTCLEEVHCAIGKFLEEYKDNDYRTLRDGMLKEVIEETDRFVETLEEFYETTTATLIDATPQEEMRD